MPVDDHLGALQSYTNARPLALPRSAKELTRELRALLIKASNERKLLTSPREINARVVLLDEPPPQVLGELSKQGLERGAFCIVGGVKNQNRDVGLAHFKRNDGAWFDFSMTVRETEQNLEVLAYDFELRFAPGMGAPFLRFDLNLPGHHNQARDLRCHLHPGSDDLLVPAPLLTPSEMLTLFVDGARLAVRRNQPRSPTKFEVDWLKETLTSVQPKQVPASAPRT